MANVKISDLPLIANIPPTAGVFPIVYNNVTYKMDWSQLNNQITASGANPLNITGTGTTNSIPKWTTGGSVIGDSVISDVAGAVTVAGAATFTSSVTSGGTITNQLSSGDAIVYAKNGTVTTMMVANSTAENIGIAGTESAHDYVIRTANTEKMRISSGGDVTLKGNGATSALIFDQTSYARIINTSGQTLYVDSDVHEFRTNGGVGKLTISSVGAIGQAVTPVSDPYVAGAEQWMTYQIGKGGVMGAYKANNESMFGFNTYLKATDGANKAIISGIDGSAMRYYADRMTFNFLTSTGTAQTQTEAMRISSGGAVKIGTGGTADANGLCIRKTGNHLLLQNTGTTAYWNFDVTSNNLLSIINSGGTNALSIASGGDTTITTTTNEGGLSITSQTDNTTLRLGTQLTGGKEWRLYSTGGTSGYGQGNFIIRNHNDSINALTISSTGTALFRSDQGAGTVQVSTQSSNSSNVGYGALQVLQNSGGRAGYITMGDTNASDNYYYQANTFTLAATAGAGMKFRVNSDNALGFSISTTGTTFFQAAQNTWSCIKENTTAGAAGLLVRLTGGSQGYYYGAFTGAAYAFFVNGAGVVNSTSQTITLISSDIRLKTDVRDYNKGLSEVLAMKPRIYKRKDKLEVDEVGFIAQEMEEALEGSMIDGPTVNEETGEKYKTFKLEWFPLLVKSIQEQQTLINTLTARIDALENN